uniref:Uncharacterized protein n=1 Tax=Arundo donax TaxID=35708 RepID=A0A0A9GY01_ARUDO
MFSSKLCPGYYHEILSPVLLASVRPTVACVSIDCRFDLVALLYNLTACSVVLMQHLLGALN